MSEQSGSTLAEALAGLESEASTETDESALLESGSSAETTENEEDGSEITGDEPETKEPEEDEAEPPKPAKKPTGSERLKRQNEALKAELAELRASRPAVAGGDEKAIASAVEAKIGKPPKEEDFDNFLEFQEERSAYRAAKRIAEITIRDEAAKSEARAADAAAEAKAERLETYRDRVEELEAALPGSKAKLAALAKAPVAPIVEELVMESDKAALLALHLAEHPAKLDELNRMTERQATKEVARLESRLSLPKTPTATKAPPPVRPLKGAAAPAGHDADLSAWIKGKYGV